MFDIEFLFWYLGHETSSGIFVFWNLGYKEALNYFRKFSLCSATEIQWWQTLGNHWQSIRETRTRKAIFWDRDRASFLGNPKHRNIYKQMKMDGHETQKWMVQTWAPLSIFLENDCVWTFILDMSHGNNLRLRILSHSLDASTRVFCSFRMCFKSWSDYCD